jgi:hypothetical protein
MRFSKSLEEEENWLRRSRDMIRRRRTPNPAKEKSNCWDEILPIDLGLACPFSGTWREPEHWFVKFNEELSDTLLREREI